VAGLCDGICELGAIEVLHCSVSARTRAESPGRRGTGNYAYLSRREGDLIQ
jgi:hypothetical protein